MSSEPWIPREVEDPEPEVAYALPRCPECWAVIDTHLAAGTDGRRGRCPEHGLVVAVYGSRVDGV